MPEKTFNIKQRIEVADLPRDTLNQLPGIRVKLVQLRNSARLSPSKAQKLKDTLQFLLDSLSEPADETQDVPATVAPVSAEKPVQKTKGTRRATAKVDKATA